MRSTLKTDMCETYLFGAVEVLASWAPLAITTTLHITITQISPSTIHYVVNTAVGAHGAAEVRGRVAPRDLDGLLAPYE